MKLYALIGFDKKAGEDTIVGVFHMLTQSHLPCVSTKKENVERHFRIFKDATEGCPLNSEKEWENVRIVEFDSGLVYEDQFSIIKSIENLRKLYHPNDITVKINPDGVVQLEKVSGYKYED